jgi:SPOR domain
MDRNGQVRKEPTLADLEAFEQLLRESLHSVGEKPVPGTEAVHAAPRAPSADDVAMAELARLIEAPIDFSTPALRGTLPEPEPATAYPHLHGAAEATLAGEWAAPPSVEAQFSPPPAPVAAPVLDLDPLASFEEELRRFDAIRLQEYARQEPAPQEQAQQEYAQQEYAQQDQAPMMEAGPSAGEMPAHDPAYDPTYPPGIAHAAGSAQEPPAQQDGAWSESGWYAPPVMDDPDPARDYAREQAAESSLNAAEERLAAEAAAAAATADAAGRSPRSRGMFMALGGVALAGLAVIGGTFAFGTGKKGSPADVPTIAAKTAPTKEKPADPGGIEIPNQNKQVLAARNTPETKPAAVVNSTEQPLDLNQVAKRDGVRVIAPSPLQNSGTSDPAAPTPPGVEPRRVTSVRLGGEPPAAQGVTPPAVQAPVVSSPPRVAIPTPPVAPPRPVALATPATTPPSTPPVAKVESRPETPKVTPPKVTAAPVATAPRPATPPKISAGAPLSLDPARQPASAPAVANAAGGGYAIQLASRPTESDARAAGGQMKAKYGAALGARAPSVVSGEANGQTVYRVRFNGYSQAEAVEACARVKAAGGGCFVTKQ